MYVFIGRDVYSTFFGNFPDENDLHNEVKAVCHFIIAENGKEKHEKAQNTTIRTYM